MAPILWSATFTNTVSSEHPRHRHTSSQCSHMPQTLAAGRHQTWGWARTTRAGVDAPTRLDNGTVTRTDAIVETILPVSSRAFPGWAKTHLGRLRCVGCTAALFCDSVGSAAPACVHFLVIQRNYTREPKWGTHFGSLVADRTQCVIELLANTMCPVYDLAIMQELHTRSVSRYVTSCCRVESRHT